MKYILLIYENEATWAALSDEEQMSCFGEYMAFTDDLKRRGAFLHGEPLQPVATATSVRFQDGRVVTTDGPFAETREQLGGFYLIEAKDLDEAIALASRIPAARMGGTVEVRPIMPVPVEVPA